MRRATCRGRSPRRGACSWISRARPSGALSGKNFWLFGLSLLTLIAVIVAASLLARRVIPREKSGRPPNELQKAAAALWTALAMTAIPVGGAAALYALADWFGLGSQEFKPLSDAFFRAVILFACAIGLGAAILAPSRPLWRPLDLTDRVATRLMNLVLVVTGLIALGKMFDAMDEVLGAALPVSVAARGTFALLVGLTLMRGLYGIVAAPDDDETPSGRPASLEDESPWWPPIRFAVWAAVVAVIGADLLGYIALSSFLVSQIAWTAFVASLLFPVDEGHFGGAGARLPAQFADEPGADRQRRHAARERGPVGRAAVRRPRRDALCGGRAPDPRAVGPAVARHAGGDGIRLLRLQARRRHDLALEPADRARPVRSGLYDHPPPSRTGSKSAICR